MSQTIKIPSFGEANLVAQTTLSADIAAAVSSLPVLDSVEFINGAKIMLGSPGSDTSELVLATTPSVATAIPLSAPTKLSHNRDEAASALYGDQIRVYAAPVIVGQETTIPALGAFILLATTNINFSSGMTIFTDPGGGSAFWYGFTYFNSTTLAETDIADSPKVRGDTGNNYCSLDDIRNEAGFSKATFITDGMIDAKRQAAQTEINGALVGTYTVPFTDPINPFIADIATRLSAGLLMKQQFGTFGTSDTANGTAKITEARADLAKLVNGTDTLVDAGGTSIAIVGEGLQAFTMWPNATTSGTKPYLGGSHRLFRVSDVQGYQTRKY